MIIKQPIKGRDMIPKHDHKEREPSSISVVGVVGRMWRLAGYFKFEGVLFAMAVTTDKRALTLT